MPGKSLKLIICQFVDHNYHGVVITCRSFFSVIEFYMGIKICMFKFHGDSYLSVFNFAIFFLRSRKIQN